MEISSRILDFDKVKLALSTYAKTTDGREKCLTINKLESIELINKSLDEIDSAKQFLLNNIDFNFIDIKEKNLVIKKLKKQITLSIEEICNINDFLISIKNIVTSYKNSEINNSLIKYFDSLNPIDNIIITIKKIIIDNYNISSSASEELKNIRIEKTKINEAISTSLNTLLNKYKNFLQEPIVATKNNRYCLPFKNEYKSKIKGIVQDTSNSTFTVFIEPFEVVELSNQLTNLEILEQDEIYKILTELTKKISNHIKEIETNCDVITNLDFIFAKLKYAISNSHTRPIINNNKYINLINAKHPLIDKNKCVPLNINISEFYKCLIITGPNTGGKTVCLKTIGLIHFMGLSGMYIPTDENSEISFFDNIFADIGDEQSIEQNLSTFSAHIKRIIYILNHATNKSLCLIDEICTGTDPVEGAHLSMGILDYLIKKNILSIITTHYSELKIYALQNKNILNGSFEFDINNLMPTYKLIMGIPGKSNAFLISEKLGMDKKIIETAKNMMDTENIKFEDLIQKLEFDKSNLEKEKTDFEKEKKYLEDLKIKIQNRQREIGKAEKTILQNAYKKSKTILEDAKNEANVFLSNVKNNEKNIIDLKTNINTKISNIEDNLKIKQKGVAQPLSPKKIKIGDTVKIQTLNAEGVVETLPDRNYNLFVRIGIVKTLVNLRELELIKKNNIRIEGMEIKEYHEQSKIKYEKSQTISSEINLIGMTTDEALIKLDKYLDDAYLSNIPSCRIIHGRGSGVLKNAVHLHLKKINFIKDFRIGEYNEGGDGVTVITFK